MGIGCLLLNWFRSRRWKSLTFLAICCRSQLSGISLRARSTLTEHGQKQRIVRCWQLKGREKAKARKQVARAKTKGADGKVAAMARVVFLEWVPTWGASSHARAWPPWMPARVWVVLE